jgi:hypothetical protein
MQRQCAWCLRLTDAFGEPLSVLPVPKIYEASHGMCRVCATLWLEKVMQDTEKQAVLGRVPVIAEVKCSY